MNNSWGLSKPLLPSLSNSLSTDSRRSSEKNYSRAKKKKMTLLKSFASIIMFLSVRRQWSYQQSYISSSGLSWRKRLPLWPNWMQLVVVLFQLLILSLLTTMKSTRSTVILHKSFTIMESTPCLSLSIFQQARGRWHKLNGLISRRKLKEKCSKEIRRVTRMEKMVKMAWPWLFLLLRPQWAESCRSVIALWRCLDT